MILKSYELNLSDEHNFILTTYGVLIVQETPLLASEFGGTKHKVLTNSIFCDDIAMLVIKFSML